MYLAMSNGQFLIWNLFDKLIMEIMQSQVDQTSTLEEHFKATAKDYVQKIDQLEQLISTKRKEQQPYKDDLLTLIKYDRVLQSLQQLINDPPQNQKDEILLYFSVQSILTPPQKELIVETGKKLGVEEYSELPITEKDIASKEKDLFEPMAAGNQSDWTDNSSVADNEDILEGVDVLAVDDDIAQAMEESDDQKKEKQGSEHSEEKVQDLEEQFVVSGKSDHHKLLKGHSKFVVSLAVDDKFGKLASGSGDDTLNIYNLEDIEKEEMVEIAPMKTLKEDTTVNILRFNYNREILVSVTQNLINIYNSAKESKKTIELSEECLSLEVHPEGNMCVASTGYEVALYNLNNGDLYNSYYSDRTATIVNFTPNGKYIIAGGKGQARVIHPKTEQIKKIEHGTQFHSEEIVCMDIKDNLMVTGGVEGLVCLSNWETATCLMKTEIHPKSVESVLFSHNFVISGCVDGGIRQFDAKTFKLIQALKYDSAVTKLIKLSNQLALSTFNGTIAVFDSRSPKEDIKFSAGSTIHELISYRDYGLFAGCEDGLIKYFDIRNYKKPETI